MINSVIVAVTLISGHVHIDNAYPFNVENVSINTAYNDCQHDKQINQKCMLLQQRDNNTLVFSDIMTGQQIIVEKSK